VQKHQATDTTLACKPPAPVLALPLGPCLATKSLGLRAPRSSPDRMSETAGCGRPWRWSRKRRHPSDVPPDVEDAGSSSTFDELRANRQQHRVSTDPDARITAITRLHPASAGAAGSSSDSVHAAPMSETLDSR